MGAEKLFEKAKKKFRFLKPMTSESVGLHLEALVALSNCREAMNLNNSAAAAMEEAARTCQNAADKKIEQYLPKITEYLNRGAYFYRLNSQYDLASRLMIKAANNTKDDNEAMKILDEALGIQEEENRYITCHEFYDGAIKLSLDRRRYKNAEEFIDRDNKMYGKDAEKYAKRIWRNILSKMVIRFHLKEVKVAQNVYYEGMEEYGSVARCDEHDLCEKFLTVFVAADVDGLINIQKNEQLGVFLINSVARIAMKLNMKDIRPINVIELDEQKDNDDEKKQNIEEAQNDVQDEHLKSEAANVELDDQGAPNLID